MLFSNVIQSCLKENIYKDWLYSIANIYSKILEEKWDYNLPHYSHSYVSV